MHIEGSADAIEIFLPHITIIKLKNETIKLVQILSSNQNGILLVCKIIQEKISK